MQSGIADELSYLVRLESVEEADLLEEIQDLVNLVVSPAHVSSEILPHIDVQTGIVFPQKPLLLEKLVHVDAPVQGTWVLLHVLEAHLLILPLHQLEEVIDCILILHDHSVGIHGPIKILIHFVSQCLGVF